VDFDFVNMREFAHHIFKFLKSERPFVLMKHGKPFKLVTSIGSKELSTLKKQKHVSEILMHPALGLWEKRWPKRKSSLTILNELRKSQERRY
jgi:hypothetical protein